MPAHPTLAAALVLLAGAAPVLAQNAINRSLTQPLQKTGWQRPDFREEVRLRNAVVTGNIGSGRSLQITPPYSDPDDFRGSLGSDSLFRFRRDSFAASPGVGFRGTESIQYQYNYTTGNARDSALITRLGGGFVSSPPATVNSQLLTASGTDLAAPRLGTLRSTAAFDASRNLSPALVGFRQGRGSLDRITASGLLGVRTETLVADFNTGRYVERSAAAPAAEVSALPALKTAYDELRERLDARERALNKPADPDSPTAPATEPATNTPSDATAPATTEPGLAPVVPPATDKSPQTGGPADATWEARLTPLRERLTKQGVTDRAGWGNFSGKKLTAEEQEKRDSALSGVDDETLAMLREAAVEAAAYVAGNPAPGDLFGAYLKDGQDMLARAEYFDAEERFARALSMRPGDVMAMTGRLHSQLGAGLFVSAAVNLRQLFEQHPEVIAMRFTGAAMPPAARMVTLTEDLKKSIADSRAKGLPVRSEVALLRAYMGYQTADAGAIRDGLSALRIAPEDAAATVEETDALTNLLERVWLPAAK